MDAFSPDAEEMWQKYCPGPPEPSGGQNMEQAFNLHVTSFLQVCQLEGVYDVTRKQVEARTRKEFGHLVPGW